VYSDDEYVDMLLAYGAAGQNGRDACLLYNERFPHRVVPSANTFVAVERGIRETGTLVVSNPDGGRQRYVRNVQFEEIVLNMVAQNPRTSSRAIGNALGISVIYCNLQVKKINQHGKMLFFDAARIV